MPSAGHDLTADRLSRAPEPLTHHRRLVVPGPAPEKPDAVDAHTNLRMIPQADQGLLGGNPAAAPASALAGLADRGLSLGTHRHSCLPRRILRPSRSLPPSRWPPSPCERPPV